MVSASSVSEAGAMSPSSSPSLCDVDADAMVAFFSSVARCRWPRVDVDVDGWSAAVSRPGHQPDANGPFSTASKSAGRS
eukprot:909673-Prymnesium_polylepis.3